MCRGYDGRMRSHVVILGCGFGGLFAARGDVQRIAFVLVASLGAASVCLAQDTARMDQIVRSYVSAGSFTGSVR